MFTDRPTVGEIVADELIAQMVDRAGVPSLLQDEARDVVAKAVREPIRDEIDGNVPASLHPDSQLMADLAEALGALEVDSTIELATGASDPNQLVGLEEIVAIRADRGSYSVPIADLSTVGGLIAADLSGRITGAATATIDRHELVLRLDVLIARVASDVLGVDVEVITQTAREAVECTALVSVITGGAATYEFRVAGKTFSLGMDLLMSGCGAARDAMFDQLLGLVRRDVGVAIGGSITLGDSDADVVADLFRNANYSGTITAAPTMNDPVFAITLDATRAD